MVLLADDNPQALRLAEQILTSQGIEVVSVTDGGVALRRLTDVQPDILITDIYLATQNGFELARYMRSESDFRHIPIIFAAAPVDRFEEQDARNAGADVILRKPFEASALLGAVNQLLERNTATRTNGKSSSVDGNSIRAAVTLALDSAMPALIDELTQTGNARLVEPPLV